MSEEKSSSGVEKGGTKWAGPLAWMARNAVAANVLMIVLFVAGGFSITTVKQEVFPEFDLEMVVVNIPYPGASPSEVEAGVVLAVEEAVRGIDGVKEVESTSSEDMGVVTVELLLGTDVDEALNEVKAAVDRITSFPENVERATVFRASNRAEVISLVIYGDVEEKNLRRLAEQAREDLLADKRITSVELFGVRALEVSIEISKENLRRYGMTLGQVASVIRESSEEIPGGAVKAKGGEVKLKTSARPSGLEFGDITLLSSGDGTTVRVSDIAAVRDGFAETDTSATFNGQRAAMVKVFRTGEQTPLDIAAAVRSYVDKLNGGILPEGVTAATWLDTSEWYGERIDLLNRNAIIGLILVLIVLGLFLEIKLAFWVTLGIPISFIGAFVFLPSWDVSINMISLFAFILVLGMVVDDAIIVGEEIYTRRQSGLGRLEAAVVGVKSVATPVCFAILTTIIFYAPMLFVPGMIGKFFRVIPIVVIATLIISLVESLVILPAHLAHAKPSPRRGVFGFIHHHQQRFARLVDRLIIKTYVPSARWASKNRYLTAAIAVAMFIVSAGMIAGGRVKVIQFPATEGDIIQAVAIMPSGTPIERTKAINQRMIEVATELIEESGGEKISRGIFSVAGGLAGQPGDPGGNKRGNSGSHMTEVQVNLVPIDKRSITTTQFARQMRERLSDVPGIDKLSFLYSIGPPAGEALRIDLRHKDIRVLERASTLVAKNYEKYSGTFNIDDGYNLGKEQLEFDINPEARSLGLTKAEIGRQIRSAFFGAEALRQQRGRDEVRVYVRLPRSERGSEYHLESFQIRTPQGGEIPLREAAHVRRGRSFTAIRRVDGYRNLKVTADVDLAVGNPSEIMDDITWGGFWPERGYAPGVPEHFPGLTWRFGGEQQEMAEQMATLGTGFTIALVIAFALLAIAFRSYVQPLIVLIAIPFGFVGALWGHVLLGFDLSMMSMMGIVALAGVVVNDSLILVVAINEYRDKGMPLHDAVVEGGARRFRPIILTSLTTFFGLAPMILETSVQARFLIPMAVSLGFGVLFATFITLLLVPAFYMIIEDLRGLKDRIKSLFQGDGGGPSDIPDTPRTSDTAEEFPRAVATETASED